MEETFWLQNRLPTPNLDPGCEVSPRTTRFLIRNTLNRAHAAPAGGQTAA